jgi:hypothetical protein
MQLKNIDLGNAKKYTRMQFQYSGARWHQTLLTTLNQRWIHWNILPWLALSSMIFFLNSKVMIIQRNIDAYESMIKVFVEEFYDQWYESLDAIIMRKDRQKHIILSIKYRNRRLSARSFFEYCRLVLFQSNNPPDFVLVVTQTPAQSRRLFLSSEVKTELFRRDFALQLQCKAPQKRLRC